MRFIITEKTLDRYQCDRLNRFVLNRLKPKGHPFWLQAPGAGAYTSGSPEVGGTMFNGKHMPSSSMPTVVQAILDWLPSNDIAPSEEIVGIGQRIID